MQTAFSYSPAMAEVIIKCTHVRGSPEAHCAAAADSSSGLRTPCSAPFGQCAATIERPGHPDWPDHARHGTPLEGLEGGPPGSEREGVLPPDDGELARRCCHRSLVDAANANARLRRDICGIEVA